MKPSVYMLTFCQDIEQLYGTLLTFQTIRKGFPNCVIHVFDNSSVLAAREEIARCTKLIDGVFQQIQNRISHELFLTKVLEGGGDSPIVFVDPDLIFWENIEDWHFDEIIAGRLIPKFFDDFAQCIAMERLHTSHLWISNPKLYKERVENLSKKYFNFQPIWPYMACISNKWYRWDTFSSFYTSSKEYCRAFNEVELNSFDHLFCGTHFKDVKSSINENFFENAHELAKRNELIGLKGLWKSQENYFLKKRV